LRRDDGTVFHWPIRVYYEDTDAGGVVYHASYIRYLERARTEWLRAAGIAQSQLAAERGLLFAVSEIDVRFRAPARLDDTLLATCRLERRGGASLRFRQELRRERDGELLVSADVRAGCLDAATFRPRPIPDDLELAP
jgi:acyl-CoA thioester hydrolase